MPRVSVVIPTYNRAAMVCVAIDSALAQTFRDQEVVVVDDGSTDGTAEVLAARYGDRIRYLRQENAGSAAARNHGVREARGELIAFLDSDCVWVPEKTALQVGYLDAHPEMAMVYSPHLPLAEDGRLLRETANEKVYHSGRIFRALYSETHFLSNPTVMIRKKVIEEVGGFDESFRLCQDAELYLRVAHAHPVGVIETPLTHYRHHPGQISKQQERKLEFLRKMYEKAYRLFRDSKPRVTGRMYRRRMADLDFKMARLLIRRGQIVASRPLVRAALWQSPWSFRLWRYAGWVHTRGDVEVAAGGLAGGDGDDD
ncbi:MAG: glycosyltransferase family 2 protein [Candidatus Brocadiae bacterium]|nr:glycosyltransferase family 2 protein [Candidatus Brocadiia bacterium]